MRLFKFAQQFWHLVSPTPPVWAWHIEVICDALQDSAECVFAGKSVPRDLIVSSPPGSTRTTLLTLFHAWIWSRNPATTISHHAEITWAQDRPRQGFLRVVENAEYMGAYPDVQIRPPSADGGRARVVSTIAGGWRMVSSIRRSMIGSPMFITVETSGQVFDPACYTLCFDDCLPQKLLGDRGFWCMLGPRTAPNDATGYLLKQYPKRFQHICLPAEDSSRVQPYELRHRYVDGLLDPVRLSRIELAGNRARLGESKYNALYNQETRAALSCIGDDLICPPADPENP